MFGLTPEKLARIAEMAESLRHRARNTPAPETAERWRADADLLEQLAESSEEVEGRFTVAEIRGRLLDQGVLDEGDNALVVRSEVSEMMVPDFESGLRAALLVAFPPPEPKCFPVQRGRCGTCQNRDGVVCDLCGNGLIEDSCERCGDEGVVPVPTTVGVEHGERPVPCPDCTQAEDTAPATRNELKDFQVEDTAPAQPLEEKRWAFRTVAGFSSLVVAEEGEWVKFEDHDSIVSSLQQERDAACEEAADYLDSLAAEIERESEMTEWHRGQAEAYRDAAEYLRTEAEAARGRWVEELTPGERALDNERGKWQKRTEQAEQRLEEVEAAYRDRGRGVEELAEKWAVEQQRADDAEQKLALSEEARQTAELELKGIAERTDYDPSEAAEQEPGYSLADNVRDLLDIREGERDAVEQTKAAEDRALVLEKRLEECPECGRSGCPWHMPEIDALQKAAADIEAFDAVGIREWSELLFALNEATSSLDPKGHER